MRDEIQPSPFQSQVYALLRQVPAGKVTTYQDLAHALGSKAYQAVGRAMNKNPLAPLVPCHRVINANGLLGGYAQGQAKKRALLLTEGIVIVDDKVDLNHYRYRFENNL